MAVADLAREWTPEAGNHGQRSTFNIGYRMLKRNEMMAGVIVDQYVGQESYTSEREMQVAHQCTGTDEISRACP
jgi:hypothetical protein